MKENGGFKLNTAIETLKVVAGRMPNVKVFSGNSNPNLGGAIASRLGVDLGKVSVTKFANKETWYVKMYIFGFTSVCALNEEEIQHDFFFLVKATLMRPAYHFCILCLKG